MSISLRNFYADSAACEATARVVFVTDFIIESFGSSSRPVKETLSREIRGINYANIPPDDPSMIVNVRNRENAISASRNGPRQKRMINTTFLCAYGERTHLCKVISLARHAHVYNRGEDKERFRAATTRYRPTRGQTRADEPALNRGSLLSMARRDFYSRHHRFGSQMLSGYDISYFYSIRCV